MTKKEEKFLRRLEERKAARGPTKAERLAAAGLKYATFCLPIQLFDLWVSGVESRGETPNNRIKSLIIQDMKGTGGA
jgi:hypothetical protein